MPKSTSTLDASYALALSRRKVAALDQVISGLEEIETVDRAFARIQNEYVSRLLIVVGGRVARGGVVPGRGDPA
jgi:hypothetical protein